MPSRRRLLCGAGSLGIGALAGCIGAGDGDSPSPGTDAETEWPRPGGTDFQTHYRADAAAPRESPSERWTAELRRPNAAPVVANGRVVVSTYEGLYGFDLASGEQVWHRWGGEDDPTTETAVILVDGTAYVGTSDPGELVAVDVEDGTTRWRTELDSWATAGPVVDRSREALVVGTTDGVRAFDRDGEPRWQFDTFGGVSAMSAASNRLYVGTSGGDLRLFSPTREGDGRWDRQLDGRIEQLTVLEGDGVIASVGGGPLTRRDGLTAGGVQWAAETAEDGFVLADDVYAVEDGLQAVDFDSGERAWSVDASLHGRPVAAGDTVYTGGNGFVAAYAMDGGTGVGDLRVGAERWRHPVGPGVVSAGLAVADGAVFAVTETHGGASRLVALE